MIRLTCLPDVIERGAAARRWSAVRLAVALCAVALGGSAWGQPDATPPAAAEPETGSEPEAETADAPAVPGNEDASEPDEAAPPAAPESGLRTEDLAARALASLAEAAQRLQAGNADAATVTVQQQAARDLEELLKQLQDAAQGQQSADSESGASEGAQSRSGRAEGSQTNQRNANRDAAQSREDADGGAASAAAELVRRRDLAQSVWGHLPPRMQDELRRSFSERFAPKYDAMIRRYYEALAEQPARPNR
ncbi:MAG: hypothetical protein KF774_09715 [Planctomyces sp.]|nr:hypothetical protein [Planctomyces sp.]